MQVVRHMVTLQSFPMNSDELIRAVVSPGGQHHIPQLYPSLQQKRLMFCQTFLEQWRAVCLFNSELLISRACSRLYTVLHWFRKTALTNLSYYVKEFRIEQDNQTQWPDTS